VAQPFAINYTPPGPQAKAFMLSEKFVRGIRGPFGSGKSVACCMEIFRRAQMQEPDANGIRKTRWAVVRNTSPELKTTTLKTWLDWFPEEVFGKMNMTPPFTHRIRIGDIDLEMIFLAMDDEASAKKLLSLELTGGWLNEVREIPKGVVDALTGRVGRFPSMKDGGATWYGVIMDTNPMPEDHWWAYMSGEVPIPPDMEPEDALMLVKPPNWDFFAQAPAMIAHKDATGQITGYTTNPDAENRANLTPDYYNNMVMGKTKDFIKVNILNQLGQLKSGKPVYPDFIEDIHVSKAPIEAIPNLPIHVGIDFGLTPAAIFGQKIRGKWTILRELCALDMGAQRFASVLKDFMAENWPEHARKEGAFHFTGDPSGDFRAGTDESTPYSIFRAAGITVLPAFSNDPIVRIEAVSGALNKLVDGAPGFLLDSRCSILKSGFIQGYCYRKIRVAGAARYTDLPDKNAFSHPHDGLQYLLMGAGDGLEVLNGAMNNARATIAPRKTSVLGSKSMNSVLRKRR